MAILITKLNLCRMLRKSIAVILGVLLPLIGVSQSFSGFGGYIEGGFSKGTEPFYSDPEGKYLVVPKIEMGVSGVFDIKNRFFVSPELGYMFFGDTYVISEPTVDIVYETKAQRALLSIKGGHFFKSNGKAEYFCWSGLGIGVNTQVSASQKLVFQGRTSVSKLNTDHAIETIQPNFRLGMGLRIPATRFFLINTELGVDLIATPTPRYIPFYTCAMGRLSLILRRKRSM